MVTTASSRPAAVQARPRAGLDCASSRQRSKVPAPIPTSRATTSIAALSGGSNRATALSLNACPYRAKSVLHRRPRGWFYGGDNYSDAGGVANEPRFAAVPPARIVPMLADDGVYLASESTFSRVLRDEGQAAHRGRAKKPRAVRPPTTHVATAPRQVWCWDMTYLPATVIGMWFHLYLILDLYSRKIVGWEVHATDDSVHAAHLVRRTALAEGIATMLSKPVLHGDNGATLKATTVLAMLYWLGVKPSYSRPRVSDDNAYSESLFRTAKYRPEFPAKGFADLQAARTWAAEFVRWYNDEHRHSGIRYVTPGQRHCGAGSRHPGGSTRPLPPGP